MTDVLLAVVMGSLFFRVPLRGSLVLLFSTSALFVTGALAMGLLISVVAKSQVLATQIAFATTFLPSFLLSGFVYAIRNMPPPVQGITHIFPARYYIAILRSIYLKGVGLRLLGGEIALLALFAAVAVTLANLRFRKTL